MTRRSRNYAIIRICVKHLEPEIETLLQQVAQAGAKNAGYILLPLPLEVAPLFEEWLQSHYPLKYQHVMTRIRDTRGGALYQNEFGQRMRGAGPYAAIIRRRFEAACQRFDMGKRTLVLDTRQFTVPSVPGDQMDLF